MKLSNLNKAILISTFFLLFIISTLRGQTVDLSGTAKAGSYQMGTVKMVPAGSGFKSIRFENETEVLAEFNASVGSTPPTFKVDQIKIGNIEIVNPIGFPDNLYFNNGNTSVLSFGLSGSSMTTDRFTIWGSLDVRHDITGGTTDGISISQRQSPFAHWRIYTAPSPVGGLTNNLEFYFNGDLKGRISSANGGYSATSDRRLKERIKELKPTLTNVLKLNPKSYVFKNTPQAKRSIGFIAQEVAEVFPELVEGGPHGEEILSLDYSGLSVLAIKAIQEQQLIISRLEQRIAALEGSIKIP